MSLNRFRGEMGTGKPGTGFINSSANTLTGPQGLNRIFMGPERHGFEGLREKGVFVAQPLKGRLISKDLRYR